MSRVLGLAALLALHGCAAGSQLTAERRDYWLYRETRVATSPEARLKASADYLREQPRGRYRAEVQAWFNRAEPAFYRLAHDRPSLLHAYLRALPKGPHAAAVLARLDEFAALNEYRARRERASESSLDDIQAALARAESGRNEVVQKLSRLVALLASIQSFGKPTSELDPQLMLEFRAASPEAACVEGQCSQAYRIDYAVPERKGLVARQADFSLELQLEAGALRRARLAGPELFSRLAEAVDKAPVMAFDVQARAEAIARAVQVIANVIEPTLPERECQRDVVAPVVFARECRGVRLSARAALEPGQADVVEVSAAATAPERAP